MALKTIKLGDFIESIIRIINDNFSGIESLKANITDLPTKTSQLTNDSGFATETFVNNKVSTVFKIKGTLNTHADLPSTSNEVGDVYFIKEHGCEWVWVGDKWEELGTTVDLSGYVEKEAGKGLSSNDYTTAEKTKLSGLSNYSLPVAGVALGGVKNGGNVTVNIDGTMTAPAAENGATVTRTDFTATDWGTLTDGIYPLTLPGAGKTPIQVWRKEGASYKLVAAGIELTGSNIVIKSFEKFEGYLTSI